MLFGTPDNSNVGTYHLQLLASDGQAQVAQSVDFDVLHTNVPPQFSSTPPTNATSESVYRYDITTADADADALHVLATTMPAWMTFDDNGDGTATLSGTPANANAGANAIVLMVTDGSASASQSFTIQVTAKNTAPTFTSTPVKSVVSGATYTYLITTADIDGDARTITAP